MSKMSSHGQKAYAEAGSVVEQTVSAIRTVASFTREKLAIDKYNKKLEKAYATTVNQGFSSGLGIGTVMVLRLFFINNRELKEKLPIEVLSNRRLLCRSLNFHYGKDYEFYVPVKLLDKYLHAMAETLDEQLVVVSQMLVADINIGYEEIVNTQVLASNGKPVKNIKSLADERP